MLPPMPPGAGMYPPMSAPPTQGSLHDTYPPMMPPQPPQMGSMRSMYPGGGGPPTSLNLAPSGPPSAASLSPPAANEPSLSSLTHGGPVDMPPAMSGTMGAAAFDSTQPIGLYPVAMNGFGAQFEDDGVEERMAPMDGRPEHKPLPEHHKRTSFHPKVQFDEGDRLPSGTDKLSLYGALDDTKYEEQQDQIQKLLRRRRINVVPMLGALFIPWILFLGTYYLSSFFLHYSNPTLAFFANASLVAAVFWYARNSLKEWLKNQDKRDFYPAYISVSCGVMLVLGIVLGDMNFWMRMVPCYNVEYLARYNNVNPSTVTLRSGAVVPARGKRYQDAGMVYFDHDTVLDLNRSMSFKMGDLFCVAPIVNKNCKKNCGYDFWAVGLNCCAEDVADFRCGEYNNPTAKAGLRLMHDEMRASFRMAVLQAEGVHNMVSTHPLFFYWLHDPMKELTHMKKLGYKEFVVLMIAMFFVNGLMVYFGLKWARDLFLEEL